MRRSRRAGDAGIEADRRIEALLTLLKTRPLSLPAILVWTLRGRPDPKRRLIEAMPQTAAQRPDARAVPTRGGVASAWAAALRLHQWSKNLLLFAPLLLGGGGSDIGAWTACLIGFAAMGCLASATYVLNDLLDLAEDRAHGSKRHRPFASGRLPPRAGLVFVPFGTAAGLALGWMAGGPAAAAMLLAYLALTLAYSLRLKREPVLDVIALGGLFTLRLVLGVVCARMAWSPWLLVFSMFLFTSLSFAKRYAELERLTGQATAMIAGRGYGARDKPVVLALGVALACAAVLVLVTYLTGEAFRAPFYRDPHLLWGLPVTLTVWLGRVWILCGRGELPDDPTAFAVRDRTSLMLGAIVAGCVLGALTL